MVASQQAAKISLGGGPAWQAWLHDAALVVNMAPEPGSVSHKSVAEKKYVTQAQKQSNRLGSSEWPSDPDTVLTEMIKFLTD